MTYDKDTQQIFGVVGGLVMFIFNMQSRIIFLRIDYGHKWELVLIQTIFYIHTFLRPVPGFVINLFRERKSRDWPGLYRTCQAHSFALYWLRF